ncbi:MAG: SET domain-containing protein [Candidatus Sungbacteria bacterium]|uniref:SET domain-containing protein n=1 Tax=Candidatus Sungiibacteriota bacterium TaxID=2750080 RepID=A0A931WNF0_9BACT|nr:SET domain-containing protein [Candidatus Sungbacteria bacterium]
MTETSTNEFSFVLKPSTHGVGVFAVQAIKTGTYLRLFGDEKELRHRTRHLQKSEVPELFRDYCVDRGETMMCPEDFGCMPVGWYLNHSNVPNAIHRDYHWYAARDIAPGEEVTINYNTLEEPEEAKQAYQFFTSGNGE